MNWLVHGWGVRLVRTIITILLVVSVVAAGVWFAGPRALQAMGLHPVYAGPRYELAGGRALIITTSIGTLGETGKATGVFASEMTAPYYEFLDGGLTVDIASIKGGEIPIDPISFNHFVRAASDERYLADAAFQAKVKNALAIADLDFTAYDIIYLAGGWGAAYDLGTSDILGAKITTAWAANRVIGGVCHGPLGLLKARDAEGKPLVTGRRLTAVSDKQVEELGITITPLHPERELRAAGATYEKATAFQDIFANLVVIDGRLVTGQNQNAGPETAQRMIEIAGGKPR
ncbi:MAG: type 1 glutamine amidotransferase domain-containing protein [Alphaproteobacteria bacterium]|nr:type 1 glutamine amidotransferase domain-containing protein [Alphaproteobacteria bacterium]